MQVRIDITKQKNILITFSLSLFQDSSWKSGPKGQVSFQHNLMKISKSTARISKQYQMTKSEYPLYPTTSVMPSSRPTIFLYEVGVVASCIILPRIWSLFFIHLSIFILNPGCGQVDTHLTSIPISNTKKATFYIVYY